MTVQWELHHTVKVTRTDTPATLHSFGHVVGLAALRESTCVVQPWAELNVAGVGLSFANWMAVISP